MFITMLIILGIVALGILGAGFRVFVPRWLIWLADFDEWWSPVRVLPPEGEMYALADATPDGPFSKLLESVATHDYNEKNHIFTPLPPGGHKPPRTGFWAENGIALVGFNKYLIMREVRYDKWEKLPGSAKWGLVSKVRPGPSIFFQYNMATSVEKVDTIGNFPVSAVVSFTVQIISPRDALFFAGGWEVQVNAAVQGLMREYIGTRKIEDLRLEKVSKKSGIVDLMKDLNGELNVELRKFGVQIIAATFIDYDLEAGDAETNKAVKAKEQAILLGEAKIETAKREAQAKKELAGGIREEYKARIEAGGEHAGTFRMAEAIEKTGLTALGSNAMVGIDKK